MGRILDDCDHQAYVLEFAFGLLGASLRQGVDIASGEEHATMTEVV
jgi:hypothetical protein